MATFKNITTAEMQEFLTELGFTVTHRPQVKELIYNKTIKTNTDGSEIKIVVFSSIEKQSSTSRGVGEDAIRVCLIHLIGHKETLVGKSKRVHRVVNWRKNLKSRIEMFQKQSLTSCPKCGNVLTEREGKFGKFLGCTNFPNCRYSQQLPVAEISG